MFLVLNKKLKLKKKIFTLKHSINRTEGTLKQWGNYAVGMIRHAIKVMLKILYAELQQYMNQELPDVQAGFSKGKGTRDQTANIP